MADLLVDTDVFVDHLRGARALRLDGDTLSYSAITPAELFAGRASEESRVRDLLAPFRELSVDRSIAQIGGRLRREHGVRLPDALIAATALVHGLALAARNVRDFERVPRLRLHGPSR